MALKLGIDLGTTYSGVSVYDGDRIETLELQSANSQKVLPSVVFYEEEGQPAIVGTAAVNAYMHTPELVVTEIKKMMGRTDYTTPPIHGIRHRPEEVSAEILKTLLNEAEEQLGEEARDAVITVPAYFGDNQRAATEEAAQIAGINLLSMISEPHAASLVYSLEMTGRIETEYVLVYDLGGGTFDVTLIHAASAEAAGPIKLSLETLSKEGKLVGGTDWDAALLARVAEVAQKEFGTDIESDARIRANVLLACERAKRDLSRVQQVQIVTDQIDHQVTVTRAEFEERTAHLLLQTSLLLESVLDDGRSKHGLTDDNYTLVLAGGSSRMPMVSTMIEETTGKAPLQFKNSDLLVTMGAAYYAHMAAGGELVTEREGTTVEVEEIIDITNRPIGIEIFRNDEPFNAEIIPPGTRFGEEFRKEFATSHDDMQEIPIVLYEGPEVANPGESADCQKLLEGAISGIPRGRPRGARVMLTLTLDQNGILKGKAIDQQTKREVEIKLDRNA